MNDQYVQGFIDKCAERGIDPQKLVKLAQAPNYRKADTPGQKCGTCKFYEGGTCTAYDFKAKSSWTCDSWATA